MLKVFFKLFAHRKQTSRYTYMAREEVEEEESSLVFSGCFYGNVDLSDHFEESPWFAKWVMQCGTRTGLVSISIHGLGHDLGGFGGLDYMTIL